MVQRAWPMLRHCAECLVSWLCGLGLGSAKADREKFGVGVNKSGSLDVKTTHII